VAAVALVGVIRAAFEVSPGGPEPDRDMATSALRLLADGLSGYAIRPTLILLGLYVSAGQISH